MSRDKVVNFPKNLDLPEVTEHVNVDLIQMGNTDIPNPEWVPTDVQPGTTPLPVYPPRGGHVERRRGVGTGAWQLAQDAGLALVGFAGLVCLLSLVAVLDDLINGGAL